MAVRSLICILILSLSPILNAVADDKAPDSTYPGPHPVASGEYRFPAAVDPDVLPNVMTEIWA